MRIGFDAKRAYHNNTGLGNYSRDLIRGLANKYKEDQYVLFTPTVSQNPRSAFINYFPNITPITPTTFFDKSLRSYWRSINLEKDLIKQKIDIYHGLSQEIPKRKGGKLKYVVTIHDLIFLRHPETYKAVDRRIYDRKFRYAAEQSDLVIAISEQTKTDLIEFYNTDPEKIRVVYQSCHDQFKQAVPEEAKNAVVEKYGLPSEFILYVGTIEKRKNLKTLVDACRSVDLPIVAVGHKTSYFKEVISAVAQNNMEHRMFFLENIPFEDLPAIYQSAKVFCYPSIFEGFGIPIIEALYSKIPVITSKGGVFKETGGEASQYADPLSVEDLRAKLLIALERDNSDQIKQGFKFVQRFSTEQFIEGVRNVYNELI